MTTINLTVPGWMNPNKDRWFLLNNDDEDIWQYSCTADEPGKTHNHLHWHTRTTPAHQRCDTCETGYLRTYHSLCDDCSTRKICKPAREAAAVVMFGMGGKVHKDLVEMLSQMVSMTRYEEDWVHLQQEEPLPKIEYSPSGPAVREEEEEDFGYEKLLYAPQKPNKKRERDLEDEEENFPN